MKQDFILEQDEVLRSRYNVFTDTLLLKLPTNKGGSVSRDFCPAAAEPPAEADVEQEDMVFDENGVPILWEESYEEEEGEEDDVEMGPEEEDAMMQAALAASLEGVTPSGRNGAGVRAAAVPVAGDMAGGPPAEDDTDLAAALAMSMEGVNGGGRMAGQEGGGGRPLGGESTTPGGGEEDDPELAAAIAASLRDP